MILRCLCLLSVSLVVVSPLHADSPAEHLKPFEPFIGKWICQGEVKDDIGTLPKGTQVAVYREYKWTMNKNAVIFNWSIKVEGRDSIQSAHLIVWDADKKKITCYSQKSDGEQGVTDWEFHGDTLIGKVRTITTDGERLTSTVHKKLVDKDTYIWHMTDRTEGGETKPDISKYTFVRVE